MMRSRARPFFEDTFKSVMILSNTTGIIAVFKMLILYIKTFMIAFKICFSVTFLAKYEE